MSKVTQIGSGWWSVSQDASKAGSGHEKRSVCGSRLVSLPLCTLIIPQGAQSRQVSALTPLERGMGEPYAMTFPSVRNRIPWKPAALWPGLLYKLIFAFSQPLLSLLTPIPHLHSFQEATSPLSCHFLQPSSYF